MRGFSRIEASLHELTTQETEFMWKDDTKVYFFALKDFISKHPIMSLPDAKKCFCSHGCLKVRLRNTGNANEG